MNILETLMCLSPFGAYSQPQKNWFLARDKKCKAPFKHSEDLEHPLEVHHLIPQRYGEKIGLDPVKSIDIPQNGIVLCRTAHNTVHPDRIKALQEYGAKKAKGEDAFAEMFEERNQKLEAGQIYWNDQYDRQIHVQIVKLNETVDLSTFPTVRHRKK